MPDVRSNNLNLGFIGLGAIAESMLVGLLESNARSAGDLNRVMVSQRSRPRSERLQTRFKSIEIGDNQAVVDGSDWIVLAVLPKQAQVVVESLRFRPDQHLVSLVAGIAVAELQQWSGVNDVVRLIPLPPVEQGLGPLPMFPPHPSLERLLNHIGTPIPVTGEDQFSAFSAASAVMATFFELNANLAAWIHQQGVPQPAATRYATSMLHALTASQLGQSPAAIQAAADECLTPGGLNEQVLLEGRNAGWFDDLRHRLDAIALRLAGRDDSLAD